MLTQSITWRMKKKLNGQGKGNEGGLTTKSPSRSDDLIWQTPSQPMVELTDPFPEEASARNLSSSRDEGYRIELDKGSET